LGYKLSGARIVLLHAYAVPGTVRTWNSYSTSYSPASFSSHLCYIDSRTSFVVSRTINSSNWKLTCPSPKQRKTNQMLNMRNKWWAS